MPYDVMVLESLPEKIYTKSNEEVINEVQSHLQELDKRTQLTPENFEEKKKGVKEILANMNKTAKAVKERMEEILKPHQDKIDEGLAFSKTLQKMILDKRTEIDERVKSFEAVKKEECYKLLQIEKESLYKSYNIEREFQTIQPIDVEKLAIISNITDGGNLSNKGKREIGELVLECLSRQQKIQKRITNLAIISNEQKLDFVISKDNIAFLNEPIEEIYQEKLNQYILREKEKAEKRKQEQERLLKEQAERIVIEERVKAEMEAKAKLEAERKILEEQKAKEIEAIKQEIKIEPKIEVQKVAGKDIFTVEAIFSFEFEEGKLSEEDVKAKFEPKLIECFKSLKIVKVKKN